MVLTDYHAFSCSTKARTVVPSLTIHKATNTVVQQPRSTPNGAVAYPAMRETLRAVLPDALI